ncbi:TRAP transporter substrate-binding protein [Congregibacter variabilis]|uniref:TRAP transporter substrate-binding protein n=1 Tax=Congregibacter variabilis TaxID=3081200 RepID=A0ABZ0HZS2_9GAMM|nr:TRAP transporter substrate-binding protein [Congregibacter sp. IMCC43200]
MIRRRSLLLAPLLLSACAERKGARPLFAADSQPENYPTTQGLFAIDRLLNERTNGEMRVRVYPGGQLGAEKDTLEIAVFGGLDLTRVNLGPLTSVVPVTSVLALPFLFASIEHARATFDGQTGRRILDAMMPYGLRGMCFYDSGARSFYNTQRQIRSPDDMAGMKIRVTNSDIYVAMVEALGANPTPIPFGEVYQALIQGVVDGAENNYPSYEGTRHFEAAGHYSLTRHVMAPEVLVASRRSWDKMTAEEQGYLQAAATESVPIMRELWDARVAKSRQRVLDHGVSVVENVDQAAFAERMSPVWDRFVTTPEMRAIVNDVSSTRAAFGGASD